MKLVYLIHSLHNPGGMERVLSVKASRLAEVPGYSVTVVTASLRSRKPFFPLSGKVVLHDLGCGDSFLSRPVYTRRLKAFLEQEKPDICISLGGHEMNVLPRMKDGSAKVAEFHFSHDKFHSKYGTSRLGKLYADWRTSRLEKTAARLDRFVVLTKEDERYWSSSLSNVCQIYNPVTLPGGGEEKAAGLEAKAVIALGRLVPQKDYPSMIRAWKIVAERHPDWTLDIFGAGPLKDELDNYIVREELEGKVRLMGLTGDVRAQLLQHSAILMSSSYEGFPLALVEAASCGLPLVSYDCPKGPSEIIRNGWNGFLVPSGHCLTLAESVLRLIEDEPLRKRMGAAALEGSGRFSLDSVIGEWTALFESLRHLT